VQLKNKFGRVLKEQRLARAMTQRDLAAELGIKASHVAYLESGQRRASLKLMQRIADVLQLEPRKMMLWLHPEARTMLPSAKPSNHETPVQAWKALIGDRALLSRYRVTSRELRALKSLADAGYALRKRDFVTIAILLRPEANPYSGAD
jgi:transcriptional regulator with XRE-family HTH domain